MQVRRVRRVVRKIDPWTVLKASFLFNVIAGLTFVLGMWVTWSIAVQRGIPESFADIFESLTLTFTPDGELYFRALVLLTVIMVIVATGAMTMGAVVYNLISDVVGGIEFSVLEETHQPVASTTRVRRMAPVRPMPSRATQPRPSAGPAASPAQASEQTQTPATPVPAQK